MNGHQLMCKSHSRKILQWRQSRDELKVCYMFWKLFIKKIMAPKENIDQINTIGHV